MAAIRLRHYGKRRSAKQGPWRWRCRRHCDNV